jgi:hypothetical protein
VAPGRLPTVLETDFKSEEADREKTDAEAGGAVDLPDGCREHNLGSTLHPWEMLMLGFDISERTISRALTRYADLGIQSP